MQDDSGFPFRVACDLPRNRVAIAHIEHAARIRIDRGEELGHCQLRVFLRLPPNSNRQSELGLPLGKRVEGASEALRFVRRQSVAKR
jgi:hypothetical protein